MPRPLRGPRAVGLEFLCDCEPPPETRRPAPLGGPPHRRRGGPALASLAASPDAPTTALQPPTRPGSGWEHPSCGAAWTPAAAGIPRIGPGGRSPGPGRGPLTAACRPAAPPLRPPLRPRDLCAQPRAHRRRCSGAGTGPAVPGGQEPSHGLLLRCRLPTAWSGCLSPRSGSQPS